MKEMKFRAFDTETNKLIYFDFNDIYGYEGEVNGIILPDEQTALNFNSGFGNNGINEDLVITQYTGLKDKNGKEIYEGDIVEERWNNPLAGGEKVDRYNVETAENSLIKMIHSSGKQQWDRYLYMRHKDVEVVGNAYDMPDWDF